MNHVLGPQLTRAGDRGLAERHWPDAIALLLNRWTAIATNCACHPGAQLQVIVCGVHDSIGRCLVEIALPESYLAAPFGCHRARHLQFTPDSSAIIRAVGDDPNAGGGEEAKRPGDRTCARTMRGTGVWLQPSPAASCSLPAGRHRNLSDRNRPALYDGCDLVANHGVDLQFDGQSRSQWSVGRRSR